MEVRMKKAIVELWEDGTFSIYVPDMKKHNLNAQGATVAEAKEKLKEAIQDYIDMYGNMGKPIPEEIDHPEFEFKYDMASFFNYFDCLNASRLAEKAGVNASLIRQYKKGIKFASEKQSNKIQTAIHRLGNELLVVRL